LGVLVSIFAVTAFAADCKVNDSDLSGEYVGGCVNGLAQGRGKAKGRDTYDGEFELGFMHGKGTYIWPATGSKYEGSRVKDKRDGFGKLSMSRGDENTKSWVEKNYGRWQGDHYVIEGIFNQGRFMLKCTSPQDCKQEQANREAQERREAAERESRERDRVANACNNFYQGKSIGFKPAGFIYLGNTLDAVVLGKGNGNVSIKIVDRHFTDLYGKTLEMSCTSDQLQ
jgi:hypothetical protein